MFLWGWDAGIARGTEPDTGVLTTQIPKAGRNEPIHNCVRFQVMNSNGPINVSIFPRLYVIISIMSLYEFFES